jgi:ferredoxin
MTYVVTEQCIRCKFTDCVDVCPVDCFREGTDMLVIEPDRCIDCAVCEPACPEEAIKPDTHPDGKKWARLNAKLAAHWPAITARKTPGADAATYQGISGKYEKYLEESVSSFLD